MLSTQYMSFNDKRNKGEPLHCTHYKQLTAYRIFQSTYTNNQQPPLPLFLPFLPSAFLL